MCIAIIPARGGSKRIPRKNIKDFCGKPMIARSIEAAIASQCFKRIIVSTDDPEIAEIARKLGAETPFLRPKELSDDHTDTSAVVRHALEWLNNNGIATSYACCIYATAPFIQVSDLQRGWKAIQKTHYDYAVTVTDFSYPIQRALRIEEKDRGLTMFNPEYSTTRSQDLEQAWHDAGQFYWGTTEAWLQRIEIFGKNTFPVKISRHRVQDIDTHEDWVQAEYLFKAMNIQLSEQYIY